MASRVLLLVVLFASQLPPSECEPCPESSYSALNSSYALFQTSADEDNSIYLVGLFSVHSADKIICGEINSRGVQSLEAFLWSVRTFTTRYPNALRGVNIKALGLDTCGSGARINQHVLNLDTCQLVYGSPPADPSDILAYIGADSPSQTSVSGPYFRLGERILVSTARLVNTPMISSTIPYVFYTSPSLTSEAGALLAVLSRLGYRYIQLVYSQDEANIALMTTLTNLTSAAEICIVNSINLPSSSDSISFDETVSQLSARIVTRAVVLLTNTEDTREMLQAASRAASDADVAFTWVATSFWGDKPEVVAGVEDIATGAITLKMNTINTEAFSQDFKSRITSDVNPWFSEYISERTDEGMDIEGIQHTIRAVDAALNGIASVTKEICGEMTDGICSTFRNAPEKWARIHEAVLNGGVFDKNTGITKNGEYTIYQYRAPTTSGQCQTHCYKEVGAYQLAHSGIIIDKDQVFTHGAALESQCYSLPCLECDETTSIALSTTSATDTPITTSAAQEAEMPPVRLRQGGWVIVLIILASVGILSVIILEIYVLVKILGAKSLMEWKSMWLGQLLLLSIFLCYLTLFAFVPSPTVAACGIIRFGVGTSYAMVFATLLVKLMIILSSKTLGTLGGSYRFLMFLFAWGLQVAVDIEWLILREPAVEFSLQTENGWICGSSFIPHVQSLVYVMVLIFLCTVLSIKTHGMLDNYREGIYIGLSAGFSIPIWLVWILLGVLQENKPELHEACLAFGLFATATLVLLLMFVPKVRQLSRLDKDALYADHEDGEYPTGYLSSGSLVQALPPGSVIVPSSHKANSVILEPVLTPGGIALSHVGVDETDTDYDLRAHNGVYNETYVKRPHVVDPHALKLIHPSLDDYKLRAESVHSMPATRRPLQVDHSMPATRRPLQVDHYASMPRLVHSHRKYSHGHDNMALSEYSYNPRYATTRSTKSMGDPSTQSVYSLKMKKAKSIQDLGSL